jgi:hypothetical protein
MHFFLINCNADALSAPTDSDVLTAGLAAHTDYAMQTAPDRYSPTHSHVASRKVQGRSDARGQQFSRLLHGGRAEQRPPPGV